MIFPIIMIVVFLVIVLFLFKIEHAGRKFKVIAIFIILALIFLSILLVFSSKKFDLHSPSGIIKATTSYFNWMGKTIANLWDVGVDVKDKVKDAVVYNETS